MSTEPTPERPTAGFARQWAQLGGALQIARGQLRAELQAVWRAAATLLSEQVAAADRVDTDRNSDDARERGPRPYTARRNAASQAVLLDILDRWERQAPLKRAAIAIEDYLRTLDELTRRLPATVNVSGDDVLQVINIPDGSGITRWMASRRLTTRPVPLMATVVGVLAESEREQLGIIGHALLTLARASQQIRRRWDVARTRLDAGHSGITRTDADHALPPDVPDSAIRELELLFANALAALDAAFQRESAMLAARFVRATAWRRPPNTRRLRQRAMQRRSRMLEHWTGQLGVLVGELQFEREEDAMERQLLALGERACSGLEGERRDLREGSEQFIAWLDARLATPTAALASSSVPRVMPVLVPATRRLAELGTGVRQAIDALSDEVELVRRLTAQPDRRASRTTIAPGRMASTAYERIGRPRFAALFDGLQAEHVALMQQMERARQVVEFATAGEGEGLTQADDASVMLEALQNARALLDGDRVVTLDALDEERAQIVETLARVFLENRLLLRRNRLGALAHIGSLGAREGLMVVAAGATPALAAAGSATGRGVAAMWRRFLIAIEWIPALESERLDVVRRPYLPREFTLDPREKDLPAIYRRLFRLDAVDDPQFLVGREREIQALVEARAMWEAGRPVSTLVVGERGSGKTSLINCALKGPLKGLPVIRGEFNARITSVSGLRGFLAELCETTPDALETTLLAERRVVVLEETERTFLRDMNGLDAIRELQRLVAATYASTLWMLVINQQGFHYLDAAVKLGDGFSHRLDAASATPEAVEEAILVRHHLSGLRLKFLAPPSERTRLARLRASVRGRGDPEQRFFAALARESAGVFRTAFELWLGQIDSLQTGTMVIKPITAPNIDAVIEQLDGDDLFALVAITQHGSLTPEEHAAVFRRTPSASRAQMDDLLAREIIESEPSRPGYRVRPGAARVVREALHRRNLG